MDTNIMAPMVTPIVKTNFSQEDREFLSKQQTMLVS